MICAAPLGLSLVELLGRVVLGGAGVYATWAMLEGIRERIRARRDRQGNE